MNASAYAGLGAVLGPLLVFVTYILSRRESRGSIMSDIMETQVSSALATTDTMKSLLEPLEKEISELRKEVQVLRTHISALETQIQELGHQPIQIQSPIVGWEM